MITKVQYINTLQGQLDSLPQDTIFYPHEHLFQNLTHKHIQQTSDNHLNLQNIDSIRTNPYSSLDNLHLNLVEEIAHEIKLIQSDNILILDSTNLDNGKDIFKLIKLNSIIPKLNILVGYSNHLKQLKPFSPQNQVLYSKESIIKSITFEINLGTNGVKPAFIGEIDLTEINLEHWMINNYLNAYLQISRLTQIPILLSLNQQLNQFQLFLQKYDINGAKLLLINPPIIINQNIDQQLLQQSIQIQNYSELAQILLKNQDIHFVFDLARYQENPQLSSLLINKFKQESPNQIYISVGVNFKQDLTIYGGKGFNILNRNQTWQLFKWAVKEKVVEIKKKWQCPQCCNEFDDDIDKFKKMEMEFCSMKCLREGIKKK